MDEVLLVPFGDVSRARQNALVQITGRSLPSDGIHLRPKAFLKVFDTSR